ncbi:MAG TPA: nitroreductase family protein [Pseudomonadales bacterium]|nr:nitroreductase family protein [Pseudomonadales bacterium]
MNVSHALQHRTSALHFDNNSELTDAQIRQLVEAAVQAPSAYNLQATRFLTVVNTEAKKTLQEIAYQQAKISDAAVTFVVLGDLEAYRKLPTITAASVAAGIFDKEKAEKAVLSATRLYSTDPALARDEAIRSASLAAMALMLSATEQGWASCPMIGFDAQKLSQVFRIASRYVPVMLVAVGPSAEGNGTRKPRLPVADVLSHDVRPERKHAFSDI